MKLTTPLEQIKGVGPKTAQALAAAGLTTVSDALNFLPRAYDDYSTAVNIADLQPGKLRLRRAASRFRRVLFGADLESRPRFWRINQARLRRFGSISRTAKRN